MKKHLITYFGLALAAALSLWLLYDAGFSETRAFFAENNILEIRETPDHDTAVKIAGNTVVIDRAVTDAAAYTASEGCALYASLLPDFFTLPVKQYRHVFSEIEARFSELPPENGSNTSE